MGLEAELGSVEEGKLADLVVVLTADAVRVKLAQFGGPCAKGLGDLPKESRRSTFVEPG